MRGGSARAGGAGGVPTPHELRAFVALAEGLHFGRTAARLGLAQSSLSEIIRRLESAVDAVLFERTSRRVALTDAGVRLLPHARQVLSGLRAVREAAGQAARPGAELRIGIEANGLAELTGPVIARFRRDHPDVSLRLREFIGDADAFLRSGLDVALVRAPLTDPRLVVHEIAREARGVLLPGGHPAAGSEGARIADFLDEPFVACAPGAPSVRDHWLAVDHRGGDRPRIGGEANSLQDVLHAVAHLGLVTTAGRSIPRFFPVPGLAFAGVDDLEPTTLCVAVRAGDSRTIVGDLVALVRRTVGELAHRTRDILPVAVSG